MCCSKQSFEASFSTLKVNETQAVLKSGHVCIRVFWARALGVVVLTPQRTTPLWSFLGPCKFWCCVRCCQGSPLEPKSPGKYIHRVPQSDPKVAQITMGDPSKHVVFMVWERHWDISEGVRDPLCFCVFSWRLSFQVSCDFWRLRGQSGAQNGVLFCPGFAPSGTISRRGAHKWP